MSGPQTDSEDERYVRVCVCAPILYAHETCTVYTSVMHHAYVYGRYENKQT